jgi:hypothetical protein
MWSTVVMFVLTFAILGLLLGFAEIYNPSESSMGGTGSPEETTGSANATSTAGQEDGETSPGS